MGIPLAARISWNATPHRAALLYWPPAYLLPWVSGANQYSGAAQSVQVARPLVVRLALVYCIGARPGGAAIRGLRSLVRNRWCRRPVQPNRQNLTPPRSSGQCRETPLQDPLSETALGRRIYQSSMSVHSTSSSRMTPARLPRSNPEYWNGPPAFMTFIGKAIPDSSL